MSHDESNTKNPLERKRFVVLVLFLMCTLTNGFQWIQYSAMGSYMHDLYNESLSNSTASIATSMTSIVFMISYIILIMPATFILNKYGLRVAFLIGSFINALGSFIKCFAIAPGRFPLAMTGQTIASFAQVFTLGNPSYLAAIWFSEEYISTVASLGVFGNQIGIALGFIIPSELLKSSSSRIEVIRTMRYIMYPLTIIEILIFILAIPFFKKKPKVPPSNAQNKILLSMEQSKGWFQCLKELSLDKNFMLLFVSYGEIIGVFYALSTNLYLYYDEYYPTNTTALGHVGLILILAGLPGSISAGFVLDKTRAYKVTAVMTCILTSVFMLIFSFVIKMNVYASYVLSFLLGFFMTGYLPVGFEVAAEMTYPINEGISSAMLNTSAQIFGILLTVIQLVIIKNYNTFASNMFLCSMLVVGSIAAFLIRMSLKRSLVTKDYSPACNLSISASLSADSADSKQSISEDISVIPTNPL